MTVAAQSSRRVQIVELKVALAVDGERVFRALVGEVGREGSELVGLVDGHKLKLCLRPGRKYGIVLDVTVAAGDRSPGRLGGNLLNLCIYKAGGDTRAGLQLAARLVGLDLATGGAAGRGSARPKKDAVSGVSNARAEREVTSRKERAQRQYFAAIADHPALASYFANRCISNVPKVARFSAGERHPDLPGTHAAMLCLMIAPLTDEICAAHFTFLQESADRGWRKAKFDDGVPARIMRGPKRGAVIRVVDPPGGRATGELLLGEGVEDVMSAAIFFSGVTAWAAGDVGNLAAVDLPLWVRVVRPILQHDGGNAAVRQARAAAFARWRAEGRDVRPWWPPGGWKDANELLVDITTTQAGAG